MGSFVSLIHCCISSQLEYFATWQGATINVIDEGTELTGAVGKQQRIIRPK